MELKEWLNLARNKLGAPVMSYAPEIAIKEYEQRIQEVTKILNEMEILISHATKPVLSVEEMEKLLPIAEINKEIQETQELLIND